MYRWVVAMDECPTASAITRTLTPLVASFVINVRLPLCEDASMKQLLGKDFEKIYPPKKKWYFLQTKYVGVVAHTFQWLIAVDSLCFHALPYKVLTKWILMAILSMTYMLCLIEWE